MISNVGTQPSTTSMNHSQSDGREAASVTAFATTFEQPRIWYDYNKYTFVSTLQTVKNYQYSFLVTSIKMTALLATNPYSPARAAVRAK
eukprot:6471733-Amphidinium_carterae.1